jgi:GTP-binding protein HflX
LYELDNNQLERAILVGVTSRGAQRWETDDHLEELALLADTAGAVVIDKMIQDRDRIDPAYFVGKGKAGIIADLANTSEADIIVFDDDLSPAQARNLERLSGKKILDRSGLILDIFARRAKTRQAKTQVELAQLNYLLPRLTRQWTHLSRQVGGIGTRGPGETQLEVDRRLIRKRISHLQAELEKIKRQRKVQRLRRDILPKVALVGYTNAGKSTLMNALTSSDVFVEDRLFATLDATVRRLPLPEPSDVLLIDTVGFIRKLPHHLVASFMSTLEEAREASLLLHVVDISHPFMSEQIAVVKDVLNQLEIGDKKAIYVFNKIDQLKEHALIARLRSEYEPAVFVSAVRGQFLSSLREAIQRAIEGEIVVFDITVSQGESGLVSSIHEYAQILESQYDEFSVSLKVRATFENSQRIRKMLNAKLTN